MSECYSRRSFLKKSTLTLGMVAVCQIAGVDKIFASTQQGNNTEQRMLVAYFSHTGNTVLVAEQIHTFTGGDMHRIKTEEAYPKEHAPCSKLAGQQLRANYRPKLASRVENMESYATVFLGYPIWWHTMPMACWTFLESYNFSGKTIVPFCTSGGDGIANSLRDIRALCPQATVQEGYGTRNAHAEKMPNDVAAWLRRVGITPRPSK